MSPKTKVLGSLLLNSQREFSLQQSVSCMSKLIKPSLILECIVLIESLVKIVRLHVWSVLHLDSTACSGSGVMLSV